MSVAPSYSNVTDGGCLVRAGKANALTCGAASEPQTGCTAGGAPRRTGMETQREKKVDGEEKSHNVILERL